MARCDPCRMDGGRVRSDKATFHSGRRLEELPLAQPMAKAPVTIRSRGRISEALHLMERAPVRRLRVTDGVGRLLGVLSLHDLARSALEEDRWFSGVTLREVAKTFAEISRARHAPEALPKSRLRDAT